MNSKGPISNFIEKHFLHFNAAALVDAAKGYEEQLKKETPMDIESDEFYAMLAAHLDSLPEEKRNILRRGENMVMGA